MWLHEFFHVVEAMAGISPMHGYYAEERRSFPGWKGKTFDQLDYFRWHARTTLKKLGWGKMNFRLKYKYRKIPYKKFKRVLSAYKNISIEDRVKGYKLGYRASLFKDEEKKMIAMYREALELSPYQSNALQFFVNYYKDRGEIRQAMKYARKYADLMDDYLAEKLMQRMKK
jgi:tetratricopeptide (TPR) repeat protein